MCGIRYAWAMGVLALGGMLAAPGWAGVTPAGDTKDDGSVFYAGYNSDTTGGLTIDAGSVFNRGDGYLGYSSGSMGTAVVTGAGSTWTNSDRLYLGYNGTGTLTVSDGGSVSTKVLYASLSDLHGDGTITAQSGAVLDADLAFDASHGLTQTLAFGSGGTLQFTVDGTVELGVGNTRSGSLRISEGRLVTSLNGILGYSRGSTGTATVSGAGSKWTNSSPLWAGFNGSGTLRVEAGGQVSSSWGYLGLNSGSTGTAIVTGAGSTWTNSASLFVGCNGSGTLRVEGGGQINSSGGTLGGSPGCTGEAVIIGAGSKWTNSAHLFVGDAGSGMLRVEAGGQVSSSAGRLGCSPGSTGTAIVSGVGSTWSNSGDLWVGYNGTGALAVSDGGKVIAGNLYLGNNGNGSLTVSDGGQVTAMSLSIKSRSTLRLHVSGDRMLVLGDYPSTPGIMNNAGTISILADGFLPTGTYKPIIGGWPFNETGFGRTLAVGGTWDRLNNFTVVAPTLVEAGAPAEVAGGMRVVIRDVTSGERAGVSFGELSSGTTLAGLPLTESERAGLLPLLDSQEMMLSGWDFAGELAGGEALVSLEVGMGAEEVRVWKLGQEGWKAYAPEMMTYDSKGIVSFTVDPAALNGSGYAVSGVVPEPRMGMVVGVIAAAGLVRRRRG